MGLFDGLFHRKPKNSKYADVLSGMAPVYSQFGTDIYASDVVQQALSCIVTEIKKLTPLHIRKNDSDYVPVKSDIQAVLKRPNGIMTTSDFIEKFIEKNFSYFSRTTRDRKKYFMYLFRKAF